MIEKDDSLLHRLVEEGTKSTKEIAKITGYSAGWVNQVKLQKLAREHRRQSYVDQLNEYADEKVKEALANYKSPNELLLDEMLQNCLKINMRLTKALQDIARLPEGDEQSAQAVAREALKEMGVKNEA